MIANPLFVHICACRVFVLCVYGRERERERIRENASGGIFLQKKMGDDLNVWLLSSHSPDPSSQCKNHVYRF